MEILSTILLCDVTTLNVEIVNYLFLTLEGILYAWRVEEQHLRITAITTGKCRFSDFGRYDWDGKKL